MTLYNGRGGCPKRPYLPGYVNPITDNEFQSPLWYNENEGVWTIEQNKKKYINTIIKEINKNETVVE